MAMRMPVSMYGKVEGTTIRTNSCHRLAPSMRPARKRLRGMSSTPAIVLSSTMNNVAKTISNTFDFSPMPNQTTKGVSKAMAGTKRKKFT